IPLFAWQAAPAVWAVAIHDRTGDPSYFKPLNAWLDKQDPAKQAMVEVVFTRNHFETAYVADRRPIARGWERQLDIKYNPLFYEDELTSARYARWLTTNDVRWVAVPRNAKIDYSGRNEADLIAARPPYLELKTTLRDWRLYEVHVPRRRSNDTVSFATAKHPLTIKPTHFGTTVTDLRWQRFQRPSRGCIEPTDNGQLELYLAAPIGPGYADTRPPAVTITTDYSLRRLVGRGASCAVGYKSKTDERAGEA
ncbi:MAG: hypothetical protein JHC87_09780, partial [Thermoleophilaceae bacterium]|nr:hypothetical protein [Thermoleophilaceae bacterium]